MKSFMVLLVAGAHLLLTGCATTLNDAVSDNDLAKVRELIAQGVNPDQHSANSLYTPLLRAVLGGKADLASFLIGKGANVNYQALDGMTPLHAAAQKNLPEIARQLIERGAEVNRRTQLSQTPLHLAAERGSTAVAKLLIEKGADLNGFDKMGWTPLIQAAISGAGETAKLLLAGGADPALRNKDGKTAAELAKLLGKQSSYDAITVFVARKEAEKKRQLEQKELEKRIAAQPCRLQEAHWVFLSGGCQQNLAEGQGEAESFDRVWRFKGIFSNGRFVSGELLQNGELNFAGSFINAVQNGKGFCSQQREACEWQNGVRIDPLHQERLRIQEQERRNQARRDREEEQHEARQKAQRECERRAKRETDENTTVRCDNEGNLQYHRHNRGSRERSARMQDYVSKQIASGSVVPQVEYRLPVPNRSSETKTALTNQTQQGQPDSRRQQETAPRAPNTKPAAMADTPKPTAPTVKEWGEAVPEAIVACWNNSKSTQWFCDGPLQETLVADDDIAKVRDLAGCDAKNDSPHEIGTSGKYRVFGCGRGLKPNERDLRKIRGVSGGSNRYRCLKADMDAGKPCRQLSDAR